MQFKSKRRIDRTNVSISSDSCVGPTCRRANLSAGVSNGGGPLRLPAGSHARDRILACTRYARPHAMLERCIPELASEADAFGPVARKKLEAQRQLPALAAKRVVGGVAPVALPEAVVADDAEKGGSAEKGKKTKKKKKARYQGVVVDEQPRVPVPQELRMRALTGADRR
eukprot:365808-Chlamydomonas_euryale.AAC.12